MLQITIPAIEAYDERKEEFISFKGQTLTLEHSLVSISKWESKWCKAFLSKNEKTHEETIDYIKCMTITQNVNPDVYNFLSAENILEINNYIAAPMTATYITKEKNGKTNREPITSELIYYWMIALNIPDRFEKWHLNRLLTLIDVCNIKNSPPKKRSKKQIMSENARLNAQRRQRLNSKG